MNRPLKKTLMCLEPSSNVHPFAAQATKNPWVTKGATFPHGTQFRGSHRGQWHYGEVDDAAFVVAGMRFRSLSAAASQIRGFSEDGWRFWEVRLPGSPEWKSLKDWLRNRRTS